MTKTDNNTAASTHDLGLEVLLLPVARGDLLEFGKGLALALEAVQAVGALKLEGGRRRGRRVVDQLEGRGVVVRVEVEEEEGLEGRRRGRVEGEDCALAASLE